MEATGIHPIVSGECFFFRYIKTIRDLFALKNEKFDLFFVQMMSAEDEPLDKVHLSPCHGMVLRGVNVKQNADIDKRHQS